MKNHGKAMNKHSHFSGNKYNKVHFLTDISGIQQLTLTPCIIEAAWKAMGLSPWDQEHIMQKITHLAAKPDFGW